MASMNVNQFYDQGQAPKQSNPIQEAYGAYTGATKQQGSDYDDIMNRYRQLYTDYGNVGNPLRSIANTQAQQGLVVPGYTVSPEYQSAIQNLGGLARTGGYSAQNLADIRERGISPIRSVYANAQQNLNRQKSLQGGYSPNYAAVSAKMAREMSSQLADQATAVNAQLAQNVAQNRLQASTPYASTTLGEQEDRNQYNLKAAELARQMRGSNIDLLTRSFLDPLAGKQSALQGMTGLYGTTPAFANMLGNQANTQASTQGQIQANNQNNVLRQIGQYAGMR